MSPEPELREIQGFDLLELIGEGGMGRVFKARQRSLGREVALKVLTPSLVTDAEYFLRFEREMKAVGKLLHENIVSVIDAGIDAATGLPYIAFELVDGPSLESVLQARERLPEREALLIAAGVLSALAHASSRGLVHRDLKPANILLASDGTPKLADLGLAKVMGDRSTLTIPGMVMGTPEYMAPEQARSGAEIDVRADLYALGLVLYRMLTGTLPWSKDEAPVVILTHHLNEDVPDPSAVVPHISKGAATVCAGLTARDPALRYATPEEALLDILRVLEQKEATGPGGFSATTTVVAERPRPDPTEGPAYAVTAPPPPATAGEPPPRPSPARFAHGLLALAVAAAAVAIAATLARVL